MPSTPNDDRADREDDESRRNAAEGFYLRGRADRRNREATERSQKETSAQWTRPFASGQPAEQPAEEYPHDPTYSAREQVMNHMWLRKGLRNGTLSLDQFGGEMPPLITPGEPGFIPLSQQFPRPDWPHQQNAG